MNGRNKKKYCLFVCCTFSFVCTLAQTVGSWNLWNVKKNFNKQWGVFAEAQIRSLDFYHQFHYYEYKAGINYKLHPQVQLSFGFGKFMTYQDGDNFKLPMKNNEVRFWPQITFTHQFNRIKMEHRYRSECRFTSAGYKNRFRYRLGLSYALSDVTTNNNPMMLSTANEIFFTDHEPFFERNRWLISLEKKISAITSFQIGYIYQTDYKINDETGKSFFQTGIYFTFQRKQHLQKNEHQLKDF